VWIVLPIMPSQAFGASDELASKASQLGGQLISPSYLATLAVGAFFYSVFFFPKGLFRGLGCLVSAVTIFLAHTRIEQISLLLLILIFALFFSSRLLRILTIALILVAVPVAVAFQDLFIEYLLRGQTLKTLATLNDRTLVWQAALDAARLRPMIGYGFMAGARNAIRDHWHYANWLPPHAHNEYLQALLSGGALAVVLVLIIYCRGLLIGLMNARKGPGSVFLFFMMILFTFRSIGGSNFTTPYTRVGALFLLTFVGIFASTTKSVPGILNTSEGRNGYYDLNERTA